MGVIQRVVKPRNKKSRRALENREPKAIENTKSSLFIRGARCSEVVQQMMKDIFILKKANSSYLSKKNNILPFEDASKIEFFSKKYDASLFMFGNHNKKRPNNVVIGRMYDYHLLDMFELGLESFKALEEFKNEKIAADSKPCLLFEGESFETKPDMQRLKSLLIDFFRGPEVDAVRLEGIEHAIQFTAVDDRILIRSYRILLKKSGTRTPRIELEEIGPSIDFKLRRIHMASDDLFKNACKQVKNVRVQKKIKNIETNPLGTKLGRVHVPKQNIRTIQTKKMKGLKEPRKEKLKEKEAKMQREKSLRENKVKAVFGE